MEQIKIKIARSLDDGFLSKEESKDIVKTLGAEYMSPKERVELIKYATNLASEKVDASNYSFVIKWLKKVTNVLGDFGSDEFHNNAFFSHTNDIRWKVIKTIESGNRSLDICVFTISDNKIADAILESVKKGLNVRVITDDEKIMDKGSDIFRLKHHNIPVKIDSDRSLMHHKFAIVDNQKVISGSFNWTRSASEVNNENVIITDNHRIVEAFRKEFKVLWEQMEFL